MWNDCIGIKNPGEIGHDLFGVGVGGILYPSSFCEKIDGRFVELSRKIKSDDVLMYLVSSIIGMKHMVAITKNRYLEYGGIGYFGYTPLGYYNDEFSMFNRNCQSNYKDCSM